MPFQLPVFAVYPMLPPLSFTDSAKPDSGSRPKTPGRMLCVWAPMCKRLKLRSDHSCKLSYSRRCNRDPPASRTMVEAGRCTTLQARAASIFGSGSWLQRSDGSQSYSMMVTLCRISSNPVMKSSLRRQRTGGFSSAQSQFSKTGKISYQHSQEM